MIIFQRGHILFKSNHLFLINPHDSLKIAIIKSKIDRDLTLTEADEFDPLHNMTKGLFWRKLKLQFVGVYLEGPGRIPQSTFS